MIPTHLKKVSNNKDFDQDKGELSLKISMLSNVCPDVNKYLLFNC